MVPSGDTTLETLQADAELAETKYTTANLLVRGFVVLFGLTAAAHLSTFVWVTQHRLLIAGALFSALTALVIWTIGMSHVDALELRYKRRQRAVDDYLNLPVS